MSRTCALALLGHVLLGLVGSGLVGSGTAQAAQAAPSATDTSAGSAGSAAGQGQAAGSGNAGEAAGNGSGENGSDAPRSDLDIARGLLSAPLVPVRKRCGEPDSAGEIVVCATDQSQFRSQSSTDIDPTSREALNTGALHPPNVSSLPDCSHGCIGIGGAPPPIYIIDLSKIPETPKGSEAEMVANGEKRDR